jgi:hypothetical protein
MAGTRIRIGLLLLAGVLALAACSTKLTRERRYTGQLAGCALTGPSTLMRSDKTFAFTPGDSSIIIRGPVGADNSFYGSLDTQPPGKPPYLLAVKGRFDAAGAAVSYSTPNCFVNGRLTLVKLNLLP